MSKRCNLMGHTAPIWNRVSPLILRLFIFVFAMFFIQSITCNCVNLNYNVDALSSCFLTLMGSLSEKQVHSSNYIIAAKLKSQHIFHLVGWDFMFLVVNKGYKVYFWFLFLWVLKFILILIDQTLA